MSAPFETRMASNADLQEQQFELVFAQAAAGMAIVAMDGRWTRVNRAFCDLTGYEPEELYELTAAGLTHPDDLDATLEADTKLRGDGVGGYELEKRYLRKEGGSIWVRIAVGLLLGKTGAPLHYVVNAHDISLRKAMEEDLARAASGALVDRDMMCAVNPAGQLTRFEGRWSEVLGWDAEELRGHDLIELVHPNDREEAGHQVRALGAGEAEWRSFRARLRTMAGNWVWLAWSGLARPEREEVVCTLREVDDRAMTESLLDLRGAMISNMTEGACLVAAGNQRIVFANPSLERMLGYAPGQLVGRRAREVMWPDDLSPREEADRTAAAERLLEHGSHTYEGRRLRLDGSSVWCRTMTTRFEHPRYGPVWVAVTHDVTEERRARQAAAELEQAKSEFLSSVSHELRTPLTSILGYAALLREDTAGVGAAGEHIDVIERNASRQLRLVEDLLSIARIEAGEFTIHRAPIDLAAVARIGVEAMRPAAREAGLSLELDCGEPVGIVGDADRLDQVLANLLSNAIKFTPAGGRIDVSVEQTTTVARLIVIDSGPGFLPEERERLFERLFRGDDCKRRQFSGAGLGLAIARSIVEAHEGSIEASTGYGAGAKFEVAIPLRERAVRGG